MMCFQDEKDQIITTNCWLNQVHSSAVEFLLTASLERIKARFPLPELTARVNGPS